jgi:hypothetical protein
MRLFGHKLDLGNLQRFGSKVWNGVRTFGSKMSQGLNTAQQIAEFANVAAGIVAPEFLPLTEGISAATRMINQGQGYANQYNDKTRRLEDLYRSSRNGMS